MIKFKINTEKNRLFVSIFNSCNKWSLASLVVLLNSEGQNVSCTNVIRGKKAKPQTAPYTANQARLASGSESWIVLLTLPTMHMCEFLYVCIVKKVKLLINGFHFGWENSLLTPALSSLLRRESVCIIVSVCVCVGGKGMG